MIEHKLAINKDAKPVKQVLHKQSKVKLEFIISKVDKLIEAGVIRAVPHPIWVGNHMVVPKPMTFRWRLCIDFTDLNKACPKDPFPLPQIDLIVDSTAGCGLLCFLEAFSGYHQILMAEEDQEKMDFITPKGCYCYTQMPFGLRNAGATFQRVMQSSLGSQLGRNVEAYIDDIVVKTQYEDSLIQELHETFENLRRVNFKLNPDKCVFGVPSGKLLGNLVSHRGIEANLDKIQVIERMEAPGESRMSSVSMGASPHLDASYQGLGSELCLSSSCSRNRGPYNGP